MRDESKVVIAFTLALKFAFIVTRTGFLLGSGDLVSHATLRHQKFMSSSRARSGNEDHTTSIGWCVAHMFADLIEWSVPDITKVRSLAWPFHMFLLLRH
jgi:hypothetical protein